MKFCTKGTHVTMFRREKRFFEILTFRPIFIKKITEKNIPGCHILAVLSEFYKTVKARKLNFCTKDAYVIMLMREK